MTERTTDDPKRGPGRPVEKPMPDLIPDTPPKREDEWRYLRESD